MSVMQRLTDCTNALMVLVKNKTKPKVDSSWLRYSEKMCVTGPYIQKRPSSFHNFVLIFHFGSVFVFCISCISDDYVYYTI